MRWPQESAITRRDEHLARTRRLSVLIAGGAAAGSLTLAAALGFALPGHSVTTSTTPSGQRSTGTGSGTGTSGGQGSTGSGTGTSGSQGSGSGSGLTPPQQAPTSAPVAPPVVSSGGS